MRYQPANAADLGSHQAMLVMLAEDVADVPLDLLENAIDKHVATSPYMPKAADLRKLAQSAMLPATSLDAYADELNSLNSSSDGGRWFVNRRQRENGSSERFLDRQDSRGEQSRYEPTAAEVSATHAVIATLIEQRTSPDEFDRFQSNGTVSRMVERRMTEQETENRVAQ